MLAYYLCRLKIFLGLFDGPIGLYGQNRYTLDSLLLTIVSLYVRERTVESSVNVCDLSGTEKLLSCLMSALEMRTGISTHMVCKLAASVFLFYDFTL